MISYFLRKHFVLALPRLGVTTTLSYRDPAMLSFRRCQTAGVGFE